MVFKAKKSSGGKMAKITNQRRPREDLKDNLLSQNKKRK